LSVVSGHIYHVLLFTQYLNDLDSKNHSDWLVPIKVFRKIGWSSIPPKSVKVFDAGLHGQKTLTKFLIENFDRVNGALHIT
jgi:hypothetical protein